MVEIYQDGIGWIPMEVTPPYLDKMDARISRRFPGREHKIRELLSRRTQQNRSKMKSRQSRKPGKAENSCRFGKF